MNTFANRFSTTNAEKELRSDFAGEDGDFSDAMWGSEAGFGSLAKGVPNFSVPAVPDVSLVFTPENSGRECLPIVLSICSPLRS